MLVDKRQLRSYFRSNARPNCCTTVRDLSALVLGISVIDNVACKYFFRLRLLTSDGGPPYCRWDDGEVMCQLTESTHRHDRVFLHEILQARCKRENILFG